ncbi:MAG: UDP-N-acetylmuramate dehydrogenase [Verrucomicrobiia bacterium]
MTAEKIQQTKIDEFAGRLKALGENFAVKLNEPMAPRTTFGVGGNADIFVEPSNEDELAAIVRLCREDNVKYYIIGRGSNLLVKDGGIRGVVIHPCGEWFERIVVNGVEIDCGAAVRLKALAGEALKHSISGFEFLEGIPGTVGGALRMNAGAMGMEIFQVVKQIKVLDSDGEVRWIFPQEAGFKYRGCERLKVAIALEAKFSGRCGEKEKIAKQMEEFAVKRRATQPQWRSAGCVFKNPAGYSAGKLIDELGLKGKKVGGAMVSEEHGNFIINVGGAKAADIIELIKIIKNEVRTGRGIELDTEVEIIGED